MPAAPFRFIRIGEVMHRTGLSRSTIRRLQLAGKFPLHLRITDGTVGWRDYEVLAWIERTANGGDR
jgi:prophage regulatory protein